MHKSVGFLRGVDLNHQIDVVDVQGWQWARVAVWDVAADGAFVNPVWRD